MIFEEQIARKPDHYPWAKEFYKTIHNGFWTVDMFDFAGDVQDFKVKMTDAERSVTTKSLSAIGQVEIAVKSFWAKLGDNLPHPCLKDLGYVMANTEVIHGDAYEKLLEVLGMEDIFEKNLALDIIKGRVNYLRKYNHRCYTDSKKQYIYALILFTLFVENVSLFSQFYIINWLYKNRTVLNETNNQVKYTRLEEQIHAMVGMKIINTIRKEHPELFDEELEQRVLHEAEQAFIAEGKIVDWMLEGMNEDSLNPFVLKEFIKNRINASLKEIKFKKVFTIDSDLIVKTKWFDEMVLSNTKTDFFKANPVEYAKKNKSFSRKNLF
jgi:ribonucleoside-diphosphate reductase beta chain